MSAHSAPTRCLGFGLLEVILVFVVVLIAGAVMFSVFHSAQVRQQASAEVQFVQASMANVDTVFPQHNYAGAKQWWTLGYLAKSPWAISPNGVSWALGEFAGSGNCTASLCPTVWMTYYYRDDQTMSEEVCVQLMTVLAQSFFVNPGNFSGPLTAGQRPKPINPAVIDQYCDRSSGVTAYMISVIRPF